jgi:hypothetical protein
MSLTYNISMECRVLKNSASLPVTDKRVRRCAQLELCKSQVGGVCGGIEGEDGYTDNAKSFLNEDS